MVTKKEPESPKQGDIQFETPWKLLAVFGLIFLGLVVYGFLN